MQVWQLAVNYCLYLVNHSTDGISRFSFTPDPNVPKKAGFIGIGTAMKMKHEASAKLTSRVNAGPSTTCLAKGTKHQKSDIASHMQKTTFPSMVIARLLPGKSAIPPLRARPAEKPAAIHREIARCLPPNIRAEPVHHPSLRMIEALPAIDPIGDVQCLNIAQPFTQNGTTVILSCSSFEAKVNTAISVQTELILAQ